MSDSVQPCRWQPTRLPHPWDSPGKNTGVGRHFLLQCMKVKNEVAQSCPTLSDPMNCSPPGSSVHGIFQARVLEWDAIAFSAILGHWSSKPASVEEHEGALCSPCRGDPSSPPPTLQGRCNSPTHHLVPARSDKLTEPGHGQQAPLA